jgi:hypothetical protein
MSTTIRMLGKNVEIPRCGNAYDKKHVYETTPFSVTSGGVSMEIQKEGEPAIDWPRIYKGKPWAAWSDVRLSQDRSMYVFPNSDLLLKSTIRRVAELSLPQEHLWLKRMFSMPNSQVKNFMAACRGLYGNEKKSMTIAVVGSKAREGTGLWHKLFAIYALSRSEEVHIDFYDSAERATYCTIDMGARRATCTWIPEFIPDWLVQEYDVVIDDAWLQGRSGLGVEIARGSAKGRGDDLFLHPTETRQFKSKVSSYQTPCPCALCVEIARCVDSYEEYQVVRMNCTRLGHNTNCVSAFYNQDLSAMSGFMKELMTKPQVEIRTNMMIRGLLSVMEEVPLIVDGAIVTTREGVPEFSQVTRYDKREVVEFSNDYPHLSGKKVLFVGVPARVLGQTKILSVFADTAQHKVAHTEAIVVANSQLWAQVTAARPHMGKVPDIYAPVSEVDAARSFPGWRSLGLSVGHFLGYRLVDSVSQELKVGQYCGKEWYPPMRLVPTLDVTRLGYPLIEGPLDMRSASYWRISKGELMPQQDPTFTQIDDLLIVDVNGFWRMAHTKNVSSGHLQFGNYSYAFLHDREKIGEEAECLMKLVMDSQFSSVTKEEYLHLQRSMPQLTIEAKEVQLSEDECEALGLPPPPPKCSVNPPACPKTSPRYVAWLRKKETRALWEKNLAVVPHRVSLTYYWSVKMVPKFVMEGLGQLYGGPIVKAVLEEKLENMESVWANLVHAYGEEYYDPYTRGKKEAKIHRGGLYGVKMKS